MADPGSILFPGNLDPKAQEFFPVNPYPYPSPPSVQLCNFYYPNYFPSPPLPLPPPAAEVFGYAPDPPLHAPCLPPRSPIQTRTILVSMLPADVSETRVRRELEVFGDVRAVQMDRVREGIVTVHFYDLRHAQWAAGEIQQQHMQQQDRLRRHFESGAAAAAVPPPLSAPGPGLIAGQAVWAQFIAPATCSIPDGNNQGTLVLHNLDPDVSARHLRDIFRSFGDVKEVRETPMKRQQRFVEFYDVRDAASALTEMNGKEINGRPLLVEFSRPGGLNSRRFPRPKSSPPSPTTAVLPRVQDHSPSSSSRKNSSSGGGKRSWKKGGGGGGGGCSGKPKGKGGREWRWWNEGNNNNNNNNVDGYDPRFVMMNEDEIDNGSDCRDLRTTVMIKNIPNKYSQKLLLSMLDNHCISCNDQISSAGGGADDDGSSLHRPFSSYDFVYLPIDFINKCNVGYGFVNMTSPEAARRLHKAFHLQTWDSFNSRKICQVTYARIQGIEALKEHFKNSRFPSEAEEYMPVVFSPPRDGRTLTLPAPIFGCGVEPTLLLGLESIALEDDDDGTTEGSGSSSNDDDGAAATKYGGAGGNDGGGRGDND
ncbi:unnamed protein product [Cuscuta campestris]|uniref:RRM domain-containing protein n=1 Tax=Cuscuta campestris TaxID=132261 RepID=A0A484MMD6_9ASTE|nr:unnamed protein product [Cuscuta campestris]